MTVAIRKITCHVKGPDPLWIGAFHIFNKIYENALGYSATFFLARALDCEYFFTSMLYFFTL